MRKPYTETQRNKMKKIIVRGMTVFMCTSSILNFFSQKNNDNTSSDKDNKYKIIKENNNEILSINITSATPTIDISSDTPTEIVKDVDLAVGIISDDLINYNIDKEKVNYYNDIANLIYKYCDIYNLNPNVIYNKALELTNDFTSESFLNYNRVDGTLVYKKERNFDTREQGILFFVRHVSQIPEDFNLTYDQIKLTNNNNFNNDFEEQVRYLCNVNNFDYEFLMAIIYSESGTDLKGSIFNNNNNPVGLYDSNSEVFFSFETMDQGIIDSIACIKYKYIEDMNLDKNNIFNDLEVIKSIHAPKDDEKDKENLNDNWSDNVKKIYYNLKLDNNYYKNNRQLN